jgi:hypothetical protein
MRERLLVRLFLRRFLEHDFISTNGDRREALSMIGGTALAVSLFTSVLIAWNYRLFPLMPPGLTSLRALDERFLFVSASMLIMALLAVAQWDALSLDARDQDVLGILPIPRAVVLRSKFFAVILLATGTDVAWNLAPTIFRVVSLPSKLSIGIKGVLTLVLAQGAVTLLAGVFGFVAVFALREGITALFGQERFRAISSAVQAALLVVLTSALLLLPGTYSNVARTWLAGDALITKALPPFWFVGLHETLAGSVIDSVPRARPQRFLVVPEQRATNLYRSLWPTYRELSRLALMGLAGVMIVTIVAAAWNSRRLPTPAIRRPRQTRISSLAWRWVVAHILAPASLRQAGFWFTLQTLPRRVNHRAVLASSLAVGLSLIVITVRGHVLEVHADVASVPLAVLAAQSLFLASVLTGFRRAAQLPAELRASSTFSLAWNGHTLPYVSGVKRAASVALVLPILAGLFLWHAALLGVRLAVLHFGLGLAFSLLLTEALFFRYRRMPFVSGYVPSSDLKSRGVAYVAGVLCLSFALAWIERLTLGAMSGYVLLVGLLVGLSAGVAACDRMSRSTTMVLDLEEEPSLPTQRFDLTG